MKYVHYPEASDKDLLLDCAADPLEQNNYINDPAYAKDVDVLRQAATAGYDAKNIIRQAQESVRRRNFIQSALNGSKVNWDYEPPYNAHSRYVR